MIMIYEIKCPLLGFENIKKMQLLKIDDVFFSLNDVNKDSGIIFTLIDPYKLRNYDIEVPKSYQELLKLTKESDIRVCNILILQNPIENSTINFLAPLIFNKTDKLMGQIVLDNIKYQNYSIVDKISNYLSKS
jgi:flagellar assembly factor FliW